MPDEKRVLKVDMGSEGIKSMRTDFPSNSHKAREAKTELKKEEDKKIKKTFKGKVTIRKKSWHKRIMQSFVGEDVDNVWGYVLHDVLIPAAKSTVTDMVQGGIEMLIYGERRSSRSSSKRDGRSHVNYNSISNRDRDRDGERDRREQSSRNRGRHDFDDITFETRAEAEEVRNDLVDLIIDYNQATVADFYELVDITGSFTDNKYGWTDLRDASITRARGGGYQINLPKTKLLD